MPFVGSICLSLSVVGYARQEWEEPEEFGDDGAASVQPLQTRQGWDATRNERQDVRMTRGQYFNFVVPQGWSVKEGIHGFSVISPDGSAAISHVGFVGMLHSVTPEQFLRKQYGEAGIRDLRILRAGRVQPQPGCTDAAMFEYNFPGPQGALFRGVAIVNVNVNATGTWCNAVMDMAEAREDLWDRYGSWLPQAAAQTSVASAKAYRADQFLGQSLRTGRELVNADQQARDYRWELSRQNAAERDAMMARQHREFGEVLTGQREYNNSHTSRPENLSTQNSVYWINPQTGQIQGSPDPNFDPRNALDPNWEPMRPAHDPDDR
jgi:hypothetical protein